MTDSRLRAMQRAAASDPSARADWLRSRLRAGALTPERLELAAYCGDEGARGALGRRAGQAVRRMACKQCRGWLYWCGLHQRPAVAAVGDVGGADRSADRCSADDQCGRDVTGDFRDPDVDPDDPDADGFHAPCPTCEGYSVDLDSEHLAVPVLPALQEFVSGLSRWGHEGMVRAALAALAPLGAGGAASRAVAAVEAWLFCPCEEHRLACKALHDGTAFPYGSPWRYVLSSVSAGCVYGSDVANAARLAARLAGALHVREAIQRALIEWALA